MANEDHFHYRNDYAKLRPNMPDGTPAVTVEETLITEVERLEKRLESAREDLRRYRLSHGT